MEAPRKVAWMKPHGHGKSAVHLVKEGEGEEFTTWCGVDSPTKKGRDEPEYLPPDDATSNCSRCEGAFRRALLREEAADLETLVQHGAMTESAARVLGEVEISHVGVKGTGAHGRVTKEDAEALVARRTS